MDRCKVQTISQLVKRTEPSTGGTECNCIIGRKRCIEGHHTSISETIKTRYSFAKNVTAVGKQSCAGKSRARHRIDIDDKDVIEEPHSPGEGAGNGCAVVS